MAFNVVYYWDACMFYEWLGAETVSDAKRAAVQNILTLNDKGANVIYTSVISHLEVLPKKLEEKHFTDDARYLKIFDGVKFLEQEISYNILMRAREIRDFYYRPSVGDVANGGSYAKVMDAADALHLATASLYGCAEFHTRDNDSSKTKTPLVTLYEWHGSAHGYLCGKYPLQIISPEDEQASFDLTQPKAEVV